MTPLLSLRDYIAALQAIGEVQEIDQEVDLDLEIGAIIRRCYETGAPAPLFQRIRGITPGFRVFGAPAGTSRQPGLSLARIALSLGLDATATGSDIVELLAGAHARAPIKPVVVPDAPCFQNVALGEAADITRLPAPLLHGGDGGRYLNTFGCIAVRTPDGSWTNWSIARIMTLDARRMTGIVSPQQHIGMVRQTWIDIGKPMPFALALGVEPAIPFVCGMPLPAHVDEADFLGGMLGRAIRTVRCRTVDLEAPASAEILIEGYMSLDETAVEGPMGEYAGYLVPGGAMQRPVYHVTAVSHRDDPILPAVVAGEPVEENHTTWGIPCAAECMHALRQAGLPVTLAWSPLDSALHWLVVTVPFDWRRRSGAASGEALCRRIGEVLFATKAGAILPKVIVSLDDIDPTDTRELVWAFATRCHPTRGNVVFDAADAPPLIAYLDSTEKMHASTAKVVYNCLPPEEWGDKLPVRSSFHHAYPPELRQRVLSQWHAYGFS
ncbi:MAG: UbiD family decarboxylase [Acetobacteraceae bacterium]